MRWVPSWIDRLMPPVVTGSLVAIIGLNLAGSAVSDAINNDLAINTASDWVRVMIAAVTFFTAALVSIRLRGFLQMVPILVGVIVGGAVAATCGMLDPAEDRASRECAVDRIAAISNAGISAGARSRPSRLSLSCWSPKTRVILPPFRITWAGISIQILGVRISGGCAGHTGFLFRRRHTTNHLCGKHENMGSWR
jgi:hypothetical protein